MMRNSRRMVWIFTSVALVLAALAAVAIPAQAGSAVHAANPSTTNTARTSTQAPCVAIRGTQLTRPRFCSHPRQGTQTHPGNLPPTSTSAHKRPKLPPVRKIKTKAVHPGPGGSEIPAGWRPPIAASVGQAGRQPAASGGDFCNDWQGTSKACNPPLKSYGGPVLHTPHVLLVFWGPKWTDTTQPDYSTYQDIINQEGQLFSTLPGSGYQGILSQYTDTAGGVSNDPAASIFEGAVNDTTPPPYGIDKLAEGGEIQQIADAYPNFSSLPDQIYILLPQEGSTYNDATLDGACAYHYDSASSPSRVYAVIPYLSDSPFDGCVGEYGNNSLVPAMTSLTAHEYAEAATNPYEPTSPAWLDKDERWEIADLCAPNSVASTAVGVTVQRLFDNNQYALDSGQGCNYGSVGVVGNPPLAPNGTYPRLTGTAALSPTDVWSVGYAYNPSANANETVAEHFDGTAWHVTTTPPVANATDNQLVGVIAPAANNVWAVGYYYDTTLYYDQTLIEHFDGQSWTIVPSPNITDQGAINNCLYGITALSPTDIWAVGEAFNARDRPLVEHYDGTSWSVVTIPALPTEAGLYQIAGIASTHDLWAVGATYNPDQTLVEHYDGTSWSVSASANPPTRDYLLGVEANNPSDVWAVGYFVSSSGYQQPLIEKFDGATWAAITPESVNTSKNYVLEAIGAVPQSDPNAPEMWAVGYYCCGALGYNDQTLMLHGESTSDGTGYVTTWSPFPSPNVGSSYSQLYSVLPLGTENILAVGEFDDNPDGQTLIEQYT